MPEPLCLGPSITTWPARLAAQNRSLLAPEHPVGRSRTACSSRSGARASAAPSSSGASRSAVSEPQLELGHARREAGLVGCGANSATIVECAAPRREDPTPGVDRENWFPSHQDCSSKGRLELRRRRRRTGTDSGPPVGLRCCVRRMTTSMSQLSDVMVDARSSSPASPDASQPDPRADTSGLLARSHRALLAYSSAVQSVSQDPSALRAHLVATAGTEWADNRTAWILVRRLLPEAMEPGVDTDGPSSSALRVKHIIAYRLTRSLYDSLRGVRAPTQVGRRPPQTRGRPPT